MLMVANMLCNTFGWGTLFTRHIHTWAKLLWLKNILPDYWLIACFDSWLNLLNVSITKDGGLVSRMIMIRLVPLLPPSFFAGLFSPNQADWLVFVCVPMFPLEITGSNRETRFGPGRHVIMHKAVHCHCVQRSYASRKASAHQGCFPASTWRFLCAIVRHC